VTARGREAIARLAIGDHWYTRPEFADARTRLGLVQLGLIRPLVAPIAAGLALCACGASSPTSTAPVTSAGATASTAATTAHRPPARPLGRRRQAPPPRHRGVRSAPNLPGVGHAQRVRALGTTLLVTVTSVIDPLRGAGASVPPGDTAVGIEVWVHNAGPGGYDSSATGDFSLRSTAGPAAPAFVANGPCQTPDRDFMNAIPVGELRSGCVSYALPAGHRPTILSFSPDGGRAGHRVSWAVP
jgi:hypothetical protein